MVIPVGVAAEIGTIVPEAFMQARPGERARGARPQTPRRTCYAGVRVQSCRLDTQSECACSAVWSLWLYSSCDTTSLRSLPQPPGVLAQVSLATSTPVIPGVVEEKGMGSPQQLGKQCARTGRPSLRTSSFRRVGFV